MTVPTLAFRDRAPAGAVPVNLDALIESKLLVQANSGGGKSWAVRYLLEQTHGRVQHIVIDREGEFSTLREKYPYMLIGREGEVAATMDARATKLLARKLLETGLSAILDLSDLSLSQQKQYVATFIDGINHLPRALWKDCLIVIDEAHLFAPEKGKGDSVAREAIALLLSTGRKRGYCVVLATQRLAKLDKDVSAECLNKMIGRTSEEDLKRAAEEIGMGKPESKALRSLEPGTFWTYGPAIGAVPIMVRTGDVDTRPPKRGTQRDPAPDTPAAIKKVLAAFADLPKQAADEQQTEDDLRREVRELRAHVIRLEKQGGRVGDVTHATMVSQIDAALAQDRAARGARLTKLVLAVDDVVTAVESVSADLGVVRATLYDEANAAPAPSPAEVRAFRRDAEPLARTIMALPKRAIAPAVSDGKVGKTGAKILGALAFYESVGQGAVPATWAAAFVGMSASGGSWGARLSELRQAGYVVSGNGQLELTDDGRRAASTSNVPLSRRELHDMWRAKLGGKARAMLDVLLEAYPGVVSKEDLAAAVDMELSGGSFGARLSEVRAPGLLDETAQRGTVRASDVLFPKGLR